jgi:hypothetical protein
VKNLSPPPLPEHLVRGPVEEDRLVREAQSALAAMVGEEPPLEVGDDPVFPMFIPTLPLDSAARKDIPSSTGLDDYAPAALAGIAAHSKRGNDKHNPGQPLHHARGKSGDHFNCIRRHMTDIRDIEAYLERYGDRLHQESKADLVKTLLQEYDALGWRSVIASQEAYEKHGNAPLAPAARLPK